VELATRSKEALVQLALLQHAQVEHLVKELAEKCARLDEVTGRHDSLQIALKGLPLDASVVQPALAVAQAAVNSTVAGDANEPTTANVGAAPAAVAERGKQAPKKRTTFGATQQPELPKVEQCYVHDSADMMCPSCGGELKPMVGQFETSEMVDVIDVSYRIEVVKRQKYTCTCGGCVETAPGPERATTGGHYSLPFAVKVAVDKYLDHLPLERQARIMARHGLHVTSQTLWDQTFALSVELAPTWEALKAHILAQRVIGVDQTGWPNLGAKDAKSWQMWTLSAVDAVFYDICDDKSAETFERFLGDFHGFVVADQLASHAAGARSSPDLTLAGCWAHILRKFREAEPNFPQARQMMDLVAELYAIDARAADRDDKAALRATESAAVLAKMKAWLGAEPTLSSTALGKAIKHTIKSWATLRVFVDDPDVWLDNNRSERAFRGPVIGRRNHHGSKTRRGTQTAATLYSLLESAKLASVDPAEYLAAAVRAARRAEVLLPHQFARK